MSQISESIWVKVQLKCASDKFYGFLRNHVADLEHLFPEQFTSSQLVEGQSFSPGSVIQFKYYIGRQLNTAKVSVKAVDDVKKYIIYEAVEGDVRKYYKEFIVKFEVIVNEGPSKIGGISFAKWTIEFEKANENVPSPEDHLDMFAKMSKGIDAYVSKN